MTTEQILTEHPDLDEADIPQALEFAAASLDADSYLIIGNPVWIR